MKSLTEEKALIQKEKATLKNEINDISREHK